MAGWVKAVEDDSDVGEQFAYYVEGTCIEILVGGENTS